jgi:hypothetical protein
MAMRTQWIVGGIGAPVGFNYPSLNFVMDMRNIKKKDRPDCFYRIRIMEAETLRIIGERDNASKQST